jgi:hypothetical protein
VQILQKKDHDEDDGHILLGEKVNAKLNPFLDGQVIEYISITVLQTPKQMLPPIAHYRFA